MGHRYNADKRADDQCVHIKTELVADLRDQRVSAVLNDLPESPPTGQLERKMEFSLDVAQDQVVERIGENVCRDGCTGQQNDSITCFYACHDQDRTQDRDHHADTGDQIPPQVCRDGADESSSRKTNRESNPNDKENDAKELSFCGV